MKTAVFQSDSNYLRARRGVGRQCFFESRETQSPGLFTSWESKYGVSMRARMHHLLGRLGATPPAHHQTASNSFRETHIPFKYIVFLTSGVFLCSIQTNRSARPSIDWFVDSEELSWFPSKIACTKIQEALSSSFFHILLLLFFFFLFIHTPAFVSLVRPFHTGSFLYSPSAHCSKVFVCRRMDHRAKCNSHSKWNLLFKSQQVQRSSILRTQDRIFFLFHLDHKLI